MRAMEITRITDPAALLGYSNASSFYRAFRRKFHHAPRELGRRR